MIKLAPGFPGVFQAAHKDQGSQTHSNVFKTSQAFHSNPKIKEPVDESPTYYI